MATLPEGTSHDILETMWRRNFLLEESSSLNLLSTPLFSSGQCRRDPMVCLDDTSSDSFWPARCYFRYQSRKPFCCNRRCWVISVEFHYVSGKVEGHQKPMWWRNNNKKRNNKLMVLIEWGWFRWLIKTCILTFRILIHSMLGIHPILDLSSFRTF